MFNPMGVRVFIMNQMKQREHTPFLMKDILEDDTRDTLKREVTQTRINNFSAPPSMTLYDYNELEMEVLGDDNEESDDAEQGKLKTISAKTSNYIKKISMEFSADTVDTIKSAYSPPVFTSPEPHPYELHPFDVNPYYMYPQYVPVMFVGYPSMYPCVPIRHPKDLQNEVTELLQTINKLSKDKNGSRTVQTYFQQAHEEDKQRMFQELMKDSTHLIKDQYGNYVFQKILEVGSQSQKKRVLESLKGKICDLSYNMFGCRVVQKILESIRNKSQEQDYFIEEIRSSIIQLIEDQNGNHVIQKIFECCFPDRTEIIVNVLIKHVDKLAFHPYGCRVIQKYLENNKGKKFKELLKRLSELIVALCHCQYGNYIIQYIVENGPLEEKNLIMVEIKNNFVELSLDKFASNVVEKAIINCNQNYRKEILKILQAPHKGRELGLVVLGQGQYSNYVIQKFLEYCDKESQRAISGFVTEESRNAINNSTYGKHVLSQLDKYHV